MALFYLGATLLFPNYKAIGLAILRDKQILLLIILQGRQDHMLILMCLNYVDLY